MHTAELSARNGTTSDAVMLFKCNGGVDASGLANGLVLSPPRAEVPTTFLRTIRRQ